jgi:hypothetical protein
MARPPKPETEKYSAVLPRTRVKKSQLERLYLEATKRGYGKKIASYIRIKLFGGKVTDEQEGMPVTDVLRNLADIGRARQYAVNNTALSELLDQIAKRHMNVIKPKT